MMMGIFIYVYDTHLLVNGEVIFWEISKGTFEIPHKHFTHILQDKISYKFLILKALEFKRL